MTKHLLNGPGKGWYTKVFFKLFFSLTTYKDRGCWINRFINFFFPYFFFILLLIKIGFRLDLMIF